MKKKKLLYIEFLRAAAIFFVIFNHTATEGFLLFTKYPTDNIQYWLYLAISIFCKFAVPVYFMISGALLLGKDEPLKVKIFIDKSIVEVFVNDKAWVMLRTYPILKESTGVFVKAFGNGTVVRSAEAWQMGGIDYSIQ